MALALAAYAWVLGLFAIFLWTLTRRHYRLPPGPKGLPIIGNVFDVPKTYEWLTYQNWSRTYDSDILHIRLLSTHVFILNSAKATKDLLDRRSTIYSDRESTVMQELTGWNRNWALMAYGDGWRSHRRIFHQNFRPDAVATYHPRAAQEVRNLLRALLDSPEAWYPSLRHMAGATILGIIYGMDVKPHHDPRLELVEESMHILGAIGNPGAFLVDSVPMLRYLPTWLPGAGFKRKAARWKPVVEEMYKRPFRDVKTAFKAGNAKPCLATTLLERLDEHEDNEEREDVLINITGTAYAGGSDTTVTALTTFVLAMLMHPDAQRAAHEELDRVVGHERLPSFEDREALPYITAIIKEVIRWRPILPLAVPHKSIADDEYEGFDIPSGSLIIGNSWAILHDADRYPDPETFNPGRFLTADGLLDDSVPDPTQTFGYSRRVCPGRHFAQDMLWLAAANILAAFEIKKAVDLSGQIVEPSGEYTSGMLSLPKPFQASFEPRSHTLPGLL